MTFALQVYENGHSFIDSLY